VTGSIPIEYDVSGRVALCVGGEPIVRRKVEGLLQAGASVRLYAAGLPVADELAELAGARLVIAEGAPNDEVLSSACLVLVSPGVARALAERLFGWARRRGVPLGAIDRPELSTFASPAALTVSGMGLRFFSFGASPGVARRLREELERALSDPRFERFIAMLGTLRDAPRSPARRERIARALEGFAMHIELHFPKWLERGEPPPG
jgi:siroheme synthase-like protein